MALNYAQQGEGNSTAYVIAATPYVTSSTISLGQIKEINFGYATRFLVVKNTGAPSTAVAVGFTENGLKPSNSNYFILSGSESFGGDIRVNKVYLSGSAGASTTFSIIGGLTFIPERNMLQLTGSNGFGGVG
jgi:hypothetical protein